MKQLQEREERERDAMDITEEEYYSTHSLISGPTVFSGNQAMDQDESMNEEDKNYVYDIYTLIDGTEFQGKEVGFFFLSVSRLDFLGRVI